MSVLYILLPSDLFHLVLTWIKKESGNKGLSNIVLSRLTASTISHKHFYHKITFGYFKLFIGKPSIFTNVTKIPFRSPMYLKIIMLHNPICRSVDPQSSKAWMGSRRATVPYRDYTWIETKLNKRIRNERNIIKRINRSEPKGPAPLHWQTQWGLLYVRMRETFLALCYRP